MTVHVSEKVRIWIREHGPDRPPKELYDAFPDINQNTLRVYVKRYKDAREPPREIRRAINEPTVTRTVTVSPSVTDHVTEEMIERRIVGLNRAELSVSESLKLADLMITWLDKKKGIGTVKDARIDMSEDSIRELLKSTAPSVSH